MTVYFRPADNEITSKKYHGEGKGVCGQACIAVLEEERISTILEDWQKEGFEWKGYTPQRDLKKYLEKKGYVVKQRSKLESFDKDFCYIARIQWLGTGVKKEKPFYGYGHWSIASANTHYILILPDNKCFFCNDTGGFLPLNKLSKFLDEEPKGIITSMLEVKRCLKL
jgi:hypothetical protein